MDSFGWCFIGCGGLAGRVARQITATGRHRIVSVYARDEGHRAAFAGAWGARAADSAEQAVAAPGVDGVYIVTPHPSHCGYARLAVEMGKPVLCEKPFAVSAGEARALFRLAEERHVYAAEAMWTWFAPVANGVRRWLDGGAFGRILRAEGFYRMGHENCPSRLTDPAQAGGALLDIGIYPVAYLYRLFGRPLSVRCTGSVRDGIDWQEGIVLTFPGGLTARAGASILAESEQAVFSLEGTAGRVRIPAFYGAGRAELHRADGAVETVEGDGSYVREFDAVAGEIRQGLTESRYVPHSATVDVLEILDECRRQMGLVYPFEA